MIRARCGQLISTNSYSLAEHEAECELCQRGEEYTADWPDDRKVDSPQHGQGDKRR